MYYKRRNVFYIFILGSSYLPLYYIYLAKAGYKG